MRTRLLGVLVVTVLGCGSPSGVDAGSTVDAGANPRDSGSSDAGTTDAGAADAGMADAGMADAGTTDAGTSDAGTTDAGTTDAGMTDAGTSDAGTTDAGTTDAGTTDAGMTDAGMTDGGSIALGLTIENVMVTGDCMPPVSPDSARIGWDTVITSPTAGSATVSGSVRFTSPGGSLATQSFTVTPPSIVFGVGTTRVVSRKAIGTPAVNLCLGYCTSGQALVTVTVMDPGSGLVLANMVRANVACVF
jgi:hypothetical protein